MGVIMSVLMSVLDKYPEAKREMVAALEQLAFPDPGGSAPCNPGGR
jgi:hypothetical protein